MFPILRFPSPFSVPEWGRGRGETASQFSPGKGRGHGSDHPRSSTQTGLPGSRSLGEVPAGGGRPALAELSAQRGGNLISTRKFKSQARSSG